jgi:hypothetical protein
VIVFAPSTTGPLRRVSATNGVPQDISTLDAEYGETNHRFPTFLPDGTHYLYAATVGTCCPAPKAARLKVGVLDSMASGNPDKRRIVGGFRRWSYVVRRCRERHADGAAV